MSKKKTVSTMSLKDFHGGSIPSDLPLPSAPGVMPKAGSERNMSSNWGNNLMRPDLRLRPKSSGAVRAFNEKASFLSHPASIGRNFDEDERKPLDGLFAPRRTIGDENMHISVSVPQDLKQEYVSSVKGSDRPVSSTMPQSPGLGANSSPARLGGGAYANSQSSIHNNCQVVSSSKIPGGNNGWGVNNNNNPPNAWGVRKDVMGAVEAGRSSASYGPSTESKYAQASALEKVSSGMWQSKSPSHLLPHLVHSEDNCVTHSVDLGRERSDYGASHGSQAESDWGEKAPSGTWQPNNHNNPFPHMLYSAENTVTHSLDVARERGDYGASWGSPAETGCVAGDGFQSGRRKLQNYWRGEPQVYTEEVQARVSSVGPQQRPEMPPELSEQLRLRSKQLETEKDSRQATGFGLNDFAHEIIENPNPPRPRLTVAKAGSRSTERPVERPKLNLKPRSQPLEQSDGNTEKERNSLFGGARPRELVLKERGIDDIAISNLDLGPSLDRAKSPKNAVTSVGLVPTGRHGQKMETRAPNGRTGKDSEQKDQYMDHERNDAERRNRRNDKWKSNRDAKDPRPEPETWRKAEELKPTLSDASGTHIGKLPSALELAHAFSKSVSDSKRHDLHSSPKGQGGRNNHIPFSRLTDNRQPYSASSPRHRINGY